MLPKQKHTKVYTKVLHKYYTISITQLVLHKYRNLLCRLFLASIQFYNVNTRRCASQELCWISYKVASCPNRGYAIA